MGKMSDLKRRLVFLVLALIVFRIGTHIPVPGINPVELAKLFDSQNGGILGMFNMFSGGALSRFSVFALGIMPYISASIIMQLLTVVYAAAGSVEERGRSGSSQDYAVHALWHGCPGVIPRCRYFDRAGIAAWPGD